MEVLEISEIRLFGLMAEIWLVGGSEKPPHEQAPVF